MNWSSKTIHVNKKKGGWKRRETAAPSKIVLNGYLELCIGRGKKRRRSRSTEERRLERGKGGGGEATSRYQKKVLDASLAQKFWVALLGLGKQRPTCQYLTKTGRYRKTTYSFIPQNSLKGGKGGGVTALSQDYKGSVMELQQAHRSI